MKLYDMSSILTRLRLMSSELRGADRKLTDYLLGHPDEVIYRSVAEVAQASDVSEATVVRFARKLGLIGFQDLKLHLSREVVSPIRSIHEEIGEFDSQSEILRKVFGSHIAALNDTLQVLESSNMSRAAEAIHRANHLFFIGVGTSGPNTLDAYNKFFRLGISCSAHTDSHLQAMAVSICKPEDVVVAISHSGNTKDPITTLKLAKQRGATTIAITNFSRSPISKIADINLFTASSETKFRAEALASRIAQVAIIDTLWTVVAMANTANTSELQATIEQAVVDKQF